MKYIQTTHQNETGLFGVGVAQDSARDCTGQYFKQVLERKKSIAHVARYAV